MSELLACPFCRGKAKTSGCKGHGWMVDCAQWAIDDKNYDDDDNCRGSIGYFDTEKEAIAAWNRYADGETKWRKQAQELAAVCEDLVVAMDDHYSTTPMGIELLRRKDAAIKAIKTE